jgi:ABC-2 type transport system permease protein
MPGTVRWFADYQPFTPIMETVRALLMGKPIGSSAIVAVAWCAAITLASYLWALASYNRDTAH